MKIFVSILFLLSCYVLFVSPSASAQTLPWSQKMANTIMSDYPSGYNDGGRKWSYVIGTVLYGFEELYYKTGNAAYKSFAQTTVANELNADGSMKSYKVTDYNSDQMREGTALIFLYKQGQETKYKTALQTIRSQINGHPRTSEGGFWHKQSYPYQMWQDGLYMVEPFYARYNVEFNNSSTADFDDIAQQFILMEKHARDSVSGLIYHGWDEKMTQPWASKTTGCSACFWGRAMGWYSMALVDVLDYFPENHPKRKDLLAIFKRLMSSLINYQEPGSGCWYQVVDYTTPGCGASNGNYLESSASIMYTYCLLKGARKSYLDESYRTIGLKAYEGFLSTFVSESNNRVTISRTCSSAGLSATRLGTFSYYLSESIVSNDGKAMGPFILASLEYESLKTDRKEYKKKRPGIYQSGSGKELIIEGSTDCPKNSKINLAYCSGRVKKSIYYSGEKTIVDISDLTRGLYLLNFHAGSSGFIQKVLIK